MSSPIAFETDLATLAVFDPEVLHHRVRGKDDWWRVDPITALDEVAQGRIAIYSFGQEGAFRVLLRAGDLTDDEKRRAVGNVAGLGLEVVSGEVFVGAGERLPGDGRGDRVVAIPGTGAVVQLEPGRWALTAHVIDWRDDEACFGADGEPLPTAPCDVVLLATKVEAPPDVPFRTPNLLDLLPEPEAKGQAKVRPGLRRRPPLPPISSGTSTPGRVPSRTIGVGHGGQSIGPAARPRTIVPPAVGPYSIDAATAAMREVVVERRTPAVPALLAVTFRPRDRTLQATEMTLDTLFDKVTRVREQMRYLETKVNTDEAMPAEDVISFEGVITSVYRSLDDLVEYLARV